MDSDGSKVRLFVAVEVPAVPSGKGSSRSGAEAPAHLTLKFLGETPEDRIVPVREALESAARIVQPFRVELRGVGAFPSPRDPRVIWVGVSEGKEQLVALAGVVDRALGALGFPPEDRPFVPHLTVLRVRSPSDRELARVWLGKEPTESFGICTVEEVLLKKSELGSMGAVHSTLGHHRFAPSPSGAT